MRTHIIALAVALAASACSPAQHRAYQNTMGGVALTGFGTATYLTYDALYRPNSPYAEQNGLIGERPSMARLAVAPLFNVAVVVGIRLLPDRLFDEHTPWIKDTLLTVAALAGTVDAYNDYRLTH